MFGRRFARSLTLVATALLGVVPAALGAPGDLQTEGAALLRCYRPTARFEKAVAISEADVLKKGRFGRSPTPHDRKALLERYGDASIAHVRLYWRGGVTAASHVSGLAVLTRTTGGHAEMRTELLADTGLVPVVPRVCRSATQWVPAPR